MSAILERKKSLRLILLMPPLVKVIVMAQGPAIISTTLASIQESPMFQKSIPCQITSFTSNSTISAKDLPQVPPQTTPRTRATHRYSKTQPLNVNGTTAITKSPTTLSSNTCSRTISHPVGYHHQSSNVNGTTVTFPLTPWTSS